MIKNDVKMTSMGTDPKTRKGAKSPTRIFNDSVCTFGPKFQILTFFDVFGPKIMYKSSSIV